jgi:CRISPR-associated protein Cas2
MIVLSLTNCPNSLRGDLTKWLLEIHTGVYVGQLNARVRDKLWERIQREAKNGSALMVFSTNNEQRLDFKVHNSDWEPIDFDGLKLMLRPSLARAQAKMESTGRSKAAMYLKAKRINAARNKAVGKDDKSVITEQTAEKSTENDNEYVVLDLETSGFNNIQHEIIEIAALKVKNDIEIGTFQLLVRPKNLIPNKIEELTGLTNMKLEDEGIELKPAMLRLTEFIGALPIVAHNAPFDMGFLRQACIKSDIPLITNKSIDTLTMARKLIKEISDHKLRTVAEYFGITVTEEHRSLADIRTTLAVYKKLFEIGKGT